MCNLENNKALNWIIAQQRYIAYIYSVIVSII